MERRCRKTGSAGVSPEKIKKGQRREETVFICIYVVDNNY